MTVSLPCVGPLERWLAAVRLSGDRELVLREHAYRYGVHSVVYGEANVVFREGKVIGCREPARSDFDDNSHVLLRSADCRAAVGYSQSARMSRISLCVSMASRSRTSVYNTTVSVPYKAHGAASLAVMRAFRFAPVRA